METALPPSVAQNLAEPDAVAWEGVMRGAVGLALSDWGGGSTAISRRETRVIGHDVCIGFNVTGYDRHGPQHDVVWAAHVGGGAPPQTLVVDTDRGDVGVWRYPNDPALPGLPQAVVPGALRWLVAAASAPIDARQVQVISLDPMRRAVVRVGSVGQAVYVKVLPPDRLDEVVSIHRIVAEHHVTCPRVLAVDHVLGLMVLSEHPGVTVADYLPHEQLLPHPTDVWALLSQLSHTAIGRATPSPTLAASLRRSHRLVTSMVPSLTGRVTDLVGRLDRHDTPGPRTVIHGDLHDRQLLVDPTTGRMGLVDLDDVGVGDLSDDLGRLLAHLSARAVMTPGHRVAVDAVVERWFREFSRHVDPTALRHRTASGVLGLALGPWRAGDPKWRRFLDDFIMRAEHWCTAS